MSTSNDNLSSSTATVPTDSSKNTVKHTNETSSSAGTLTWEEVRHPNFPAPGSNVDYEQWILDNADPSLLWNGILDIPIFSDEGAAKLAAITQNAIDNVNSTRLAAGNMHSYGTDLFPQHATLVDTMVAQLEPIINLVFLTGQLPSTSVMPPTGTLPQELVNHSAHCIGYSNTPGQREKKLQLHVDDSLITINICCGVPGFTGSDLLFKGFQKLPWSFIAKQQRRMPVAAEQNEISTKPVPTRALIHFGAHPHRTVPIETGQRFNWVLWYHKKTAIDTHPSSSVPTIPSTATVGESSSTTTSQ